MGRLNFVVKGALIAALYAAITLLFHPISYGPLQVRVSEALVILPYFEVAAIPGLFIGCLIANIFGGYGPWDIFGGSLLTLVAAFFTWLIGTYFRKREGYFYLGPLVALLPPVLLNAFGVAYILKVVLQVPYLLTVIYVGVGEAIAVYFLGYPLLLIILKRRIFLRV